jgi:hypothetical protein
VMLECVEMIDYELVTRIIPESRREINRAHYAGA